MMHPRGNRCRLAIAAACLAGLSSRAQESDRLASLVAALSAPSRPVQLAAVEELAQMGPAAAAAVPALSGLALSPEWRLSQPAASALARIDTNATVALLMPRLEGNDEAARRQAVKALEYVGPGAAPFVPALIEVVRTAPDDWTRAAAANALGQIGPAAAEAVPVLTEGLRQPAEQVRRYCAKGLGGIGAAAAPAIPELERAAASDGERRLADWAREALARIRAAQRGP